MLAATFMTTPMTVRRVTGGEGPISRIVVTIVFIMAILIESHRQLVMHISTSAGAAIASSCSSNPGAAAAAVATTKMNKCSP